MLFFFLLLLFFCVCFETLCSLRAGSLLGEERQRAKSGQGGKVNVLFQKLSAESYLGFPTLESMYEANAQYIIWFIVKVNTYKFKSLRKLN